MSEYTEFSDEQIDIRSMFNLEFSLALQCVSLPAPINEKQETDKPSSLISVPIFIINKGHS